MKKRARRRKPLGTQSASGLENKFWRLWQLRAGSSWPSPLQEHLFHDTRKWRFDFAWPRYRVAVEIEGGVFTQGRHTRSTGFIADCAKYNAAALHGWLVLRYTGQDLQQRPVQVVDEVLSALQSRCNNTDK